MRQITRWGILGTGNIAAQFARGLRDAAHAQLLAVGSRSREHARRFSREFAVEHVHASYARLAEDLNVDVVYVATPHHLHAENTLLCLDAGKAVLCEKPLAINATQAQQVISAAQRRRRFLMEALWTRFLPPFVKLRQLLAEGLLGEVRLVTADFGFCAPREPHSRLFDPALAGGCLLDVGVYPISLATMILGTPVNAAGLAVLGPTGVDEQTAIVLRFEHGRLACLHAAINLQTPQQACIIGERGFINLGEHWWKGAPMRITLPDRSWVIDLAVAGTGYQYEADEVHRCLHAGRLQSDIMPLGDSLTALRVMDDLRASWGLKYPMV